LQGSLHLFNPINHISMKMRVLCLLFLLSITVVVDGSNDRFNYDVTDLENRNFGPADWGMVECDDIETCVSCPKSRIPFCYSNDDL
jgi:hypothetical protein